MKEKGEILAVGDFTASGSPINWVFGPSKAAALHIVSDRELRFAGWTVEELREVHRQRAEGER